jgi:hypothetical protein
MTRARRRPLARARRRPGVVTAGGWLVLLLAALSFVTWRQTRGVEMEGTLRELEVDRGIAEAERVAALRRVEELRGRARIVRVARERLGMRVPRDSEVVFLPVGKDGGR